MGVPVSPVSPVSSDQAIQGLLSQYSERKRKRKRHSHENACKTGVKILGDRLDLNEKKEPFSPSYLKI